MPFSKLGRLIMDRNHKFYFISSIVLVSLLLLPSCLFPYELENRVQAFTLKNGLRLLMLERHLSPTVSIYIRYRSGAVDERDGKTGTAHLLEHMMFKGTKTIGTKNYHREEKLLLKIEQVGAAVDREKKKGNSADQALLTQMTQQLKALQKTHRRLMISNEIDRLYTEQGAVGLNASTGQDLTTYQVSIPSNRIELWARIESDRMANPVFREFYTERDVVMEERRQRYESDPDGKLLELYLATAFIAHPYRRPVIGWPSDLRFLDMAYMRNFFQKTHAPNNTVIAVVGDIRPSEVLRIVEKYFGRLPAQELDPRPVTVEPVQSGERRIEVLYAADPKLILGYHKPAPPAFDDYVFDLIESLLTRGRTARLFKTLIEEKRLAKSIQAHNGFPGARYANQFVFFTTPRHPHTNMEVETALAEEIERLKNEPVSDEELGKVKKQVRADFIRGLDSNAGLAGMLSYYEALLGDYHYLTGYAAAIDKITPDDIRQTARTYLIRENRTVAAGVRKP
ncbi:MAG: insulinase family protein [Syntrophus sp. (in: bacteria)]|nr:insulinase family protein [Syntrophus sp. (in: bacteria)]